MKRYFNTTGSCNPKKHYMVDISKRLGEIKKLVDRGEYFTVNRARQYGKTTTLAALAEYLQGDYIVISLDFQLIGNAKFASEHIFTQAFANYLLRTVSDRWNPISGLDDKLVKEIAELAEAKEFFAFDDMFPLLSELCSSAEKPIVMMIDEADSATNNQVFLDFLVQLRGYYLNRDKQPTFQSVILAGVYDVKNIRRKIRPEDEHKINSPWNIAADFKIDMSFSKAGIEGMLKRYEEDYHTGMNTEEMAELLFAYTSGYPFLVSRICKLMDEDLADGGDFPDKASVWTKEGFLTAVRMLLSESNTLFESLMGKMHDYPEMAQMVQAVLFSGNPVLYNPDVEWMNMAVMFGFIKRNEASVKIANRIFEMRLYNYFHLKKGYMLSYNFNKKKEVGVKEIPVGDRILVEAVV